MPPLRKTLNRWFEGASRVAVLGVGSEIRADDAAGLFIVKLLRKSLASIPADRFAVFDGGSAPENLTGEIVRFSPTHVLVVDAADFGARPGTVRTIAKEQIGEVSFSTHRLSLLILTEYLERSIACKTMVLGIQPKRIGILEPMSRIVERNVNRIGMLIASGIQSAVGGERADGRKPKPSPASF